MSSISDWLYSIFGDSGDMGMLIIVFLIFFIDAVVFPALPELFFVIAFMYKSELGFGLEILAVALIAELFGVWLLYFIVSHIRIPKRVEKIVHKYIDFLILGDERLVLLNRVAPMIPFCGAFISIAGWDIKRSLLYVFIGGLVKYGIILCMSDFFFEYFSSNDAQLYTLIFIFAVIIISFILSIFYKRKNGLE